MRRHPQVSVKRVSPIYESEAHRCPGSCEQRPYLNAVAEIATDLDPHGLLAFALSLERARGRQRPAPNGDSGWAPQRLQPRTLDVDVLLFGQKRLADPYLELPHPRLPGRLFVLCPLADIAPEMHLPSPLDCSVMDVLARCPDTGWLRRVPLPDLCVQHAEVDCVE